MTILHFLASERRSARSVLARARLEDLDSSSTYRVLEAMIEQPRVKVVGLCCCLDGEGQSAEDLRGAAMRIIGLMERVYREHRIIMSELIVELGAHSLSGLLDEIRGQDAVSGAFEEMLDDACALNRFPRPTLTLMTDLAANHSGTDGDAQHSSLEH